MVVAMAMGIVPKPCVYEPAFEHHAHAAEPLSEPAVKHKSTAGPPTTSTGHAAAQTGMFIQGAAPRPLAHPFKRRIGDGG